MERTTRSDANGPDNQESELEIPEVSLITSWNTPVRQAPGLPSTGAENRLSGLFEALQEGAGLLDLYFLNHLDIPWYAAAGGIQTSQTGQFTPQEAQASTPQPATLGARASRPHVEPPPTESYPTEPHAFVASLTPGQLDRIADTLRANLSHWYGGKLVGRRPRLACFATFFPNLSAIPESGTDRQRKAGRARNPRRDPGATDIDLRRQAVQAVRNTLYLAGSLGVSCVEAVGGSGVPRPTNEVPQSPDTYRAKRWEALVQSLIEIYDLSDDSNPLKDLKRRKSSLPLLAMELEPGMPFLLNQLKRFKDLRTEIEALSEQHPHSLIAEHLCLNVDIAHAFILGYTPKHITDAGLDPWVAHMHLSDHGGDMVKGGMHASDLTLGVFHYYEDYLPWLVYAIKLMGRPERRFSQTIAMEMEACGDISEAFAAVQITRQWLREVSRDPEIGAQILQYQKMSHLANPIDALVADTHIGPTPQLNITNDPKAITSLSSASERNPRQPTGALLVVDIGNSTQELLRRNLLEPTVRNLCKSVHRFGGSVMSFTGDGFIALFEESYFSSQHQTAQNALEATREASAGITGNVTIRAALHWGEVSIPASGQLRDQIIGENVVRTARLCDWLGRVIEPAQWKEERATLIAATAEFLHILTPQLPEEDSLSISIDQQVWHRWGKVECKGLSDTVAFRLLSPLVITTPTAGTT